MFTLLDEISGQIPNAILISAAACLVLAACTQPAAPIAQRPDRDPTAAVTAIRAAGAKLESSVEVKPLRDPAVDGLLEYGADDLSLVAEVILQVALADPAALGNTIAGDLQVTNNTGNTGLTLNHVGGNVEVLSNGATSVFVNTVTGSLDCENNSSIQGGGNTASEKLGQCALF